MSDDYESVQQAWLDVPGHDARTQRIEAFKSCVRAAIDEKNEYLYHGMRYDWIWLLVESGDINRFLYPRYKVTIDRTFPDENRYVLIIRRKEKQEEDIKSRGITTHKGRWIANLRVEGKVFYIGSFATKQEALDAQAIFADELKKNGAPTNKFRQVRLCPGVASYQGRWRVDVRKDGQQHYLGMFKTFEEAKAAKEEYDKLHQAT